MHNGLGVIYMKLGQTPAAIAEFNEALRQRPDDREAPENLRFAQRSQSGSGVTQPR